MRTDRILTVAASIKEHSHLFDMSCVGDPDPEGDCGTPGCILGFALALFHDTGDDKDIFDLPQKETDNLFYPTDGLIFEIQPHHAISCLHHLAETGKVDWKRALDRAEYPAHD